MLIWTKNNPTTLGAAKQQVKYWEHNYYHLVFLLYGECVNMWSIHLYKKFEFACKLSFKITDQTMQNLEYILHYWCYLKQAKKSKINLMKRQKETLSSVLLSYSPKGGY